MSRLPQQVYTYNPSNYYYEDAEESYVGDYSENEGISEGFPQHLITANPDLTEVYRGKAPPQQERVYHQQQPWYYAHE